mmetsp:Transcript_29374/g.95871  ORF Transcript_29374/g.95871 Transcript_29374/m.95871 type:complete len:201 (+) Transcript_29374:391-993(+)
MGAPGRAPCAWRAADTMESVTSRRPCRSPPSAAPPMSSVWLAAVAPSGTSGALKIASKQAHTSRRKSSIRWYVPVCEWENRARLPRPQNLRSSAERSENMRSCTARRSRIPLSWRMRLRTCRKSYRELSISCFHISRPVSKSACSACCLHSSYVRAFFIKRSGLSRWLRSSPALLIRLRVLRTNTQTPNRATSEPMRKPA